MPLFGKKKPAAKAAPKAQPQSAPQVVMSRAVPGQPVHAPPAQAAGAQGASMSVDQIERHVVDVRDHQLRPLEEFLQHDPSPDVLELVQTFLHEAKASTDQLQAQADICVAQERFDVMQQIFDLHEHMNELEERAGHWMRRAQQGGSSGSTPASPARPQQRQAEGQSTPASPSAGSPAEQERQRRMQEEERHRQEQVRQQESERLRREQEEEKKRQEQDRQRESERLRREQEEERHSQEQQMRREQEEERQRQEQAKQEGERLRRLQEEERQRQEQARLAEQQKRLEEEKQERERAERERKLRESEERRKREEQSLKKKEQEEELRIQQEIAALKIQSMRRGSQGRAEADRRRAEKERELAMLRDQEEKHRKEAELAALRDEQHRRQAEIEAHKRQQSVEEARQRREAEEKHRQEQEAARIHQEQEKAVLRIQSIHRGRRGRAESAERSQHLKSQEQERRRIAEELERRRIAQERQQQERQRAEAESTLRSAMEGPGEVLQWALEEAKHAGVSHNLLNEAEGKLHLMQQKERLSSAKHALKTALQTPTIEGLRNAISRAKDVGVQASELIRPQTVLSDMELKETLQSQRQVAMNALREAMAGGGPEKLLEAIQNAVKAGLPKEVIEKARTFQKALGLFAQWHSMVPSEESPVTYRVVHDKGARVREGFQSNSANAGELPKGTIVSVVETRDRRARIVKPMKGWVSMRTEAGYITKSDLILEICPAHDTLHAWRAITVDLSTKRKALKHAVDSGADAEELCKLASAGREAGLDPALCSEVEHVAAGRRTVASDLEHAIEQAADRPHNLTACIERAQRAGGPIKLIEKAKLCFEENKKFQHLLDSLPLAVDEFLNQQDEEEERHKKEEELRRKQEAESDHVEVEAVPVAFTIDGLSFEALASDKELTQNFAGKIKMEIASHAGVDPTSVNLKLKPGSVKVDAAIQAGNNNHAAHAKLNQVASGGALHSSIAKTVKAVPGIGKATVPGREIGISQLAVHTPQKTVVRKNPGLPGPHSRQGDHGIHSQHHGSSEPYRIIASEGALVRQDFGVSSPEVCELPCETIVFVAEIRGRRARIVKPVSGWLSTHTQDGHIFHGSDIIEKCKDPVPTEESPITYEVVHHDGALVRAEYEITSHEVCELPHETLVSVVEIRGRRGRISKPVAGWLSMHTKDGLFHGDHIVDKTNKAMPSERSPVVYKVLKNTVVHRGYATESTVLHHLQKEARVSVVELRGHRARILDPVMGYGWVSVHEDDGRIFSGAKILQVDSALAGQPDTKEEQIAEMRSRVNRARQYLHNQEEEKDRERYREEQQRHEQEFAQYFHQKQEAQHQRQLNLLKQHQNAERGGAQPMPAWDLQQRGLTTAHASNPYPDYGMQPQAQQPGPYAQSMSARSLPPPAQYPNYTTQQPASHVMAFAQGFPFSPRDMRSPLPSAGPNPGIPHTFPLMGDTHSPPVSPRYSTPLINQPAIYPPPSLSPRFPLQNVVPYSHNRERVPVEPAWADPRFWSL
eukprot:gnl/MRDRNA2_/MRDRNA2_69315_c0_seq2.p1 gnl/MRDRNA2_/MRDRNA2_69315_c0~~gnl/MRDRNA2_/MRDRNA2_69315_c0_seq2.p1  ORF type:complete len:1504 (-),score=358.30 gnl/MRDRNA2_/MRDRNA2_69315_c0_seq2:149-4660(-)